MRVRGHVRSRCLCILGSIPASLEKRIKTGEATWLAGPAIKQQIGDGTCTSVKIPLPWYLDPRQFYHDDGKGNRVTVEQTYSSTFKKADLNALRVLDSSEVASDSVLKVVLKLKEGKGKEEAQAANDVTAALASAPSTPPPSEGGDSDSSSAGRPPP